MLCNNFTQVSDQKVAWRYTRDETSEIRVIVLLDFKLHLHFSVLSLCTGRDLLSCATCKSTCNSNGWALLFTEAFAYYPLAVISSVVWVAAAAINAAAKTSTAPQAIAFQMEASLVSTRASTASAAPVSNAQHVATAAGNAAVTAEQPVISAAATSTTTATAAAAAVTPATAAAAAAATVLAQPSTATAVSRSSWANLPMIPAPQQPAAVFATTTSLSTVPDEAVKYASIVTGN
jgi:hypothetical protein